MTAADEKKKIYTSQYIIVEADGSEVLVESHEIYLDDFGLTESDLDPDGVHRLRVPSDELAARLDAAADEERAFELELERQDWQ